MLYSAFKSKRKLRKSGSIPQADLISFGIEVETIPGMEYPVSYPEPSHALGHIQGNQELYPHLHVTLFTHPYSGQVNHDSTGVMASTPSTGLVTAPAPRPRKTPAVQSKAALTSHSALSLVKKAAAGIQDQATPYHKAIYQDKRVIETFDKYILAKSEGQCFKHRCISIICANKPMKQI
jgi:hypothetical protein